MFETESGGYEKPRPGVALAAGWFATGFLAGTTAVLLPPVLAQLSQGYETAFPPAPFFLLALGVGLFIGMAIASLALRRP